MLRLIKRWSTLDRYLFADFTGPFLFSVAGFLIIGIVDIIFALVDLFVNSGVSIGIITRLLLYKIPAILVLFLPMSAIFSTMLLMVRMAKENELTVIRTSGISIFRVITPILAFGIIVSILSWSINEFVTPWTNRISDHLIRTTIQKKPPPKVVDNVFFKDTGNRYFYIESVNIKNGNMNNLMMFEKTSNRFPRIVTAKKASWDNEHWYLFNGYINELNDDGDIKLISNFDQTIIYIARDLDTFYTKYKTPREMDSSELKTKINTLTKGGVNTRALEVEYHLKKSLPASCFIFSLMGITFCVMFVRSGKDWWGVITAIIFSVLLVGFYFFLTATFRALGKKGIIDPFLSAWIPNLIYFLPCSALLIYDGIKR